MHPVLFEIFGYPIHSYSTLMMIGCVVGLWMSVRYGEQMGYERGLVYDLCWWLIVGGYLGARLVFMVVNWESHWYPCVDPSFYQANYPADPITGRDCTRLLYFWSGGLVFYGAFIGGFLTLVWFTRREKLAILPLADLLLPSFALGQFFGRLGCLSAGCCFGKHTTLPWGIDFPRRSMVFHQHLEQGLVQAGDPGPLAVHPTQLYDSLYGLLIFVLLIWIRQRKRYHGQVFIWWLFLYPLFRSIVEIFRGDLDRGFVIRWVSEPLNEALGLPQGSVTFFSASQFISLTVMLLAGLTLWRLSRSEGSRPTGPAPGEAQE